MTQATFTITEPVCNGLLPASAMQQLHGFLEGHEGKWAEVTVRISEKRRSSPQNRFYHGAFIGALRQCFLDCGVRLSHDDIHEGLRDAWAKNERTVTLSKGGVFKIPASTARLSTSEFSDFLEEVRAHFAQAYGWQLPHVNEIPMEAYNA